MLMVGFHGTDVSPSLEALLEDPLVTGVIWFRRNVESTAQVAQTNAHLRSLRPDLLIAIDQEGGLVRRLREGVTLVPAMREVQDEAEARRWGGVLGRELRALGFNVNFAPVLDVDSNPNNPIIGSRSFGRDPAHVGRLGVALHQAMVAEGVASCGKHFPGHGDTDTDSHLDLPVVLHPMERVYSTELLPFRAAIDAGIPMIMTAHLVLAALDAGRPATLSPAVLGGLLRGELGFDGVIVGDDLDMKALADHYGTAEAVALGLEAGVDLFLACADEARMEEALAALRSAPTTLTQPARARIRKVAEIFRF